MTGNNSYLSLVTCLYKIVGYGFDNLVMKHIFYFHGLINKLEFFNVICFEI